MEIGHINSVIAVFSENVTMPYMEIGQINSVFTVFRRRQSLSVRVDGQSLSVRGWGRVQVLSRSAFDSRPYILRFCAVNCTTRHLVSSDLNKSCRPGLLVLVSYIKCLKSMCNSCTHLSTVTIYPKVYYSTSGSGRICVFSHIFCIKLIL